MKKIWEQHWQKLLALLVVLVLGMSFWAEKDREEPFLDNLEQEQRLAVKKNVVVLGVDNREDEFDTGRSDTLFVVMLDEQKQNLSLLSIPRDTRVKLKGYGWDKINHAYAYGGRELTQQTVEELLGIRVDHYVLVDFSGFQGLVDAIGGVDINVEKDMYYHDSWDGFTVDLKQGEQHLDGATAIQYVRYRDEEGDIGRIQRQQKFLLAVYRKINSANMLVRIPGLAQQLNTMIETNMPLSNMMDMARGLRNMMRNQGLQMNTVEGTPVYLDDISYWIPDIMSLRTKMVTMQGAVMTEEYRQAAQRLAYEYEQELHQALAEEEKAKAEQDAERQALEAGQQLTPFLNGTIVKLINCSGDPEKAQLATAQLTSAGFQVIDGGEDDKIRKTVVVSTTNDGAVIARLDQVPFKHRMKINRKSKQDYHGIVLLGKDFK